MNFEYKKLEILPSPATQRKKSVWRPIIPVILKSEEIIVGYEALIDSGADYNVFPTSIAQALGIEVTKGSKRQIVGFGEQKIKGYEHTLELRVSNKWYSTKIIFSSRMPTYSFGVLGNQGFFNHFLVTLNYLQKDIQINLPKIVH